MASESDATAVSADREYVKNLIKFLNSGRSSIYSAFGWEGNLLTYLEQEGVPVVRSEEGAPCDGALLCQPTAATGYALTVHTIKHNPQVIPIDTKACSITVDRQGHVLVGEMSTSRLTESRPLQRELVQLFIVFLSNSQEVLFLPKSFTDMPHTPERWEEYRGTEVPQRYLPFVVRFQDMAEACNQIRACANDKTRPYVNPSNGVVFPAGLFETKPASSVLSTSRAAGLEDQRRFIHNAVSKHAELTFTIPLIPVLICDWCIGIPGCGEVRFEAKIGLLKVDGTELHHLVGHHSHGGRAKNVFHRKMTIQYVFTQSNYDFAYVIPVSALPEAWYEPIEGSENVWDTVPKSLLKDYLVNLKSKTWVEDLVRIVRATWPPKPAAPGPSNEDLLLAPQLEAPQLEADELPFIDKAIIDDNGSHSITPNPKKQAPEVKSGEHDKHLALPLHEAHQYLLPPGMFSTQVFDSEGLQYLQIQKACAHVGQGLIVPYERPYARSFEHTSPKARERRLVATYCYVEYKWTSDEVRDFFELNKLPLQASRLAPTTLVLPLALARLGNRTHTLIAANRTLRILAHPRKEVVLWYSSAASLTADRATVEGAADDQMLLVPSDHISIDKKDLMSLKQTSGVKFKVLDDILTQPSLHFRCPFREVVTNLAKFFDDPFDNKPGFYVRDERLAVRKEEYLCFWKDVLQDQVDGLWEAYSGAENAEDSGGSPLEDDDEEV